MSERGYAPNSVAGKPVLPALAACNMPADHAWLHHIRPAMQVHRAA